MEDYADYKFSDNELDNALFHEFLKDKPSEQYIRELIAQGANINAIDKGGESVLTNTIFLNGQETNLQAIQLLINLGADVNYEEDGNSFNCLFNAALTYNPTLVELLLKAGANPNCISVEDSESLLDWAYFEWGFVENEYGSDTANQMEIIVRLLEKYGGKFSEDLFADKPEKQLKIFATYDTGLFTAGGNLRIEQIPNADEVLITKFNEWLKTNPDNWQEHRKNKYLPKPEILEQHNQQGLSLAKRIKNLVGNDIIVTFLSVSSEDIRDKHVRNVKHTVIENMKNEKPIKRYFKLMADYGSAWGWEINHYADGSADEICIATYDEDVLDGIKIPSELAKRIEEWQRDFERTDPFGHNDNFDWDNFSKRGIRLAIELKKHIGHLFDAFYYDTPFEDDLNRDISNCIEIRIK